MTYHPKYIRDSLGRNRAVQISMREWKSIEKELAGTAFLARLQEQLNASLKDVELHLQGRKRLKTVEEMLAGM